MKKKKVYERPLIKPIVATMPGKSGNNVSLPLVAEIDGHTPSSLLKKFGSPLFLFSESTLRNNFKEAQSNFLNRYPNVCFAWSYKTNYLNAICKIFHEEGAWAEVVSGFEYKKALQNGVRGTNIIFNGPNKSEEDLLLAIDNESLIHIDNLQELILLSHLSERCNKIVNVAIRVNLDAGISPAWSRFGFNLENGEAWRMVTKIIQEKKLNLKGLHCHIGTFILSLNAYKVQAKKMAALAEKIYNEDRAIVIIVIFRLFESFLMKRFKTVISVKSTIASITQNIIGKPRSTLNLDARLDCGVIFDDVFFLI